LIAAAASTPCASVSGCTIAAHDNVLTLDCGRDGGRGHCRHGDHGQR
jgi:hypothetical protein